MWTNPQTGSKSFCVGNPDATILASVDLETLDLRNQKLIEDEYFVSMRENDGHLYAAARFRINCKLDGNLKLVEISDDLNSKELFHTTSVNSIEATDLAITQQYFVIVGRLRTFLSTSSARPPFKFEEQAKRWDDSFWESNEDQLSALILVVDKTGAEVGNRVISGVATHAIQNVVALDKFNFVAAGSTFGERGWMMSFSLQKPGISTWRRIETWLEGIGTHFRKRNRDN